MLQFKLTDPHASGYLQHPYDPNEKTCEQNSTFSSNLITFCLVSLDIIRSNAVGRVNLFSANELP